MAIVIPTNYQQLTTDFLENIFERYSESEYRAFKNGKIMSSESDVKFVSFINNNNDVYKWFYTEDSPVPDNSIYCTGGSYLLTKHQFGAYVLDIYPCVGYQTSYSDSDYLAFGVILEHDKETNKSLVFIVSDHAITFDPLSFTPNNDSAYNNTYLKYSIVIYDHNLKKVVYVIQPNYNITNVTGSGWTANDEQKGWDKSINNKLVFRFEKYISSKVVSYDISVTTDWTTPSGSYNSISYDHEYVSTSATTSSHILLLELKTSGTVNENLKPFLELESTRNAFYRPFGLMLLNYKSFPYTSMVSSIAYINSRYTDDDLTPISKTDISPTVSISNWRYGQTASNPSVTGNTGNGAVTYKYKLTSASDSTYTTTKPSTPGNYTIKAEIAETDNYNSGTATSTFTISKGLLNLTVSMQSYIVGGTPSNPSLSGNTGNGTVTYSYKVSTASDSTYTSAQPTAVGTYTVKASVAETTNYESGTATTNFSITNKNALNLTLSMQSYKYGETPSSPVLTGNTGGGAVTYTYKVSTADDSTYTPSKPSTPGNYIVRAVVAETSIYQSGTVTANFSVTKNTLNLTLSMGSYATGATPSNPILGGNVGGGSVTYSYKLTSSPDSSYTSTKPTTAGSYTVKAVVAETANYESGTVTATFNVTKSQLRLTLSMASYKCGDTPSEPVLNGNTGGGAVTYSYKPDTAQDTAYVSLKPTTAGNYIVRAEVAETTAYGSKTVTARFSVTKKSITLSVSMANYYDYQTPTEPVCTGNTGGGTVTFYYKLTTEPDSMYGTVKPRVEGTYNVKAVLSETEIYEGKTAISTFSVLHRQSLNASMTMNNYVIDELANILNAGTVPEPKVIGNLGNAPIKFEYKRKGQRSNEYTSVFPYDIDEYDIRATIHETDTYEETVIYSTFSIYTTDSDMIEGRSIVSIKSNTTVGSVSETDTKIYGEYKDSADTLREKMTLEKIDFNNNLNILSQYSIGTNKTVHIDTSISGKIPFTIEKYVIIDDKIICYTSSKKSRYDASTDLHGTPFSLCTIDTQSFFNALVNNAPNNSIAVINVPKYEQKPTLNGSTVTSYHYDRLPNDNIINLEGGFMYNDYDSEYDPNPDMMLFSGDSKVITKNGLSISNSSYGRYIIEMPMKHIKEYFPDMKIFYETRMKATV